MSLSQKVVNYLAVGLAVLYVEKTVLKRLLYASPRSATPSLSPRCSVASALSLNLIWFVSLSFSLSRSLFVAVVDLELDS